MKKLFLYSSIALLVAATATTGLAKDKNDKKKDKDKDKDRVVYVERDGQRYTLDRDGKRHRIDGGDYRDDRDSRDYRSDDRDYRDYRGDSRDRTRSIYIIQGNRPVQQTVYIGSDGRYYRSIEGRRSYVSERYYESYPSKYYYPDGRRRVTITLPF